MSYKLKQLWGTAIENSLPEEAQGETSEAIGETVEIEVDEDGAPLEAVDAAGEPTVDAMETDFVEAEAEVDDAEDVVENLDKTQETLESFRVVLESRISSGEGISPAELEMMMVGVEGRIPVVEGMFPSTESAQSNRLSAATEALESVKAGLASIWAKIMDAIKSLFAKIKNWYLKTFDIAPRLKKRAEAVAKKAGQVQGSISNKKISMSNNRTICADNRKGYSSAGNAVNAMKELSQVPEVVLEKANALDNEGFDEMGDLIGRLSESYSRQASGQNVNVNGANLLNSVDTVFASKLQTYAGLVRGISGAGSSDPRYSKYKHTLSPTLPGRKAILFLGGLDNISSDINTGDITAHYRNVGVRLVEPEDKSKKSTEGSADYPTLDAAAVQDICTYIITIMDSIMTFKKGWEDRDKNVKEVLKSIDNEVKNLEKDDDLDGAKRGRSLFVGMLNGFRNYVTSTTSSLSQITGYLITTCKGFLLYCTRSLAQYKK